MAKVFGTAVYAAMRRELAHTSASFRVFCADDLRTIADDAQYLCRRGVFEYMLESAAEMLADGLPVLERTDSEMELHAMLERAGVFSSCPEGEEIQDEIERGLYGHAASTARTWGAYMRSDRRWLGQRSKRNGGRKPRRNIRD